MVASLKQAPRGRAVLPAAPEEAGLQYLTFVLGGETFGMPIRFIREVIPVGSLTEVPLMPAFVRGLGNLRGAAVPVLDLSVRIGRARTELTPRTCVVVLEVPCQERTLMLGCLVDQVREVLEVGAGDIEPLPAFGDGLDTAFLAGVARVAGRFVILLEAGRVLSEQELARLADAALAAAAGAATLAAQEAGTPA